MPEHLHPHGASADGAPGKPGEHSSNSSSRPRRLSRSPHPYHRRGNDPTREADLADGGRTGGYLPSPSPTPSPYDSDFEAGPHSSDDRARRKPTRSSSDSGTEADNEAFSLLRGLPAPPTRSRKGLRDSRGTGLDGLTSPIHTPASLGDIGRSFSAEFRHARKAGLESGKDHDAASQKKLESFQRKRAAEIQRRALEIILIGSIGWTVSRQQKIWRMVQAEHRGAELLSHVAILIALFSLYPLRLYQYHTKRRAVVSEGKTSARIRFPSTFDPAPLCYPPFLPVFVALLLLPSNPHILLPNLVLSISTLPASLIPGNLNFESYNPVHWLITCLPVLLASMAPTNLLAPSSLEPALANTYSETLVSLYPLHQALLPILQFLAATSLLPTEFHLLSISLINLLFFSASPQTVILTALLWGGGLSIFILCGRVFQWGIALARIPAWRFRRDAQPNNASKTFPLGLVGYDKLPVKMSFRRAASDGEESDADEDGPPGLDAVESRHASLGGNLVSEYTTEPLAVENNTDAANGEGKAIDPLHFPRRRHTLSTYKEQTAYKSGSNSKTRGRRKRRTSSSIQSYLAMTPKQASLRKWLYAIYTYITIVLIVLIGVRSYVAGYALNGAEPVGWAIGYMLGNIQELRLFTVKENMDGWIQLPDWDNDMKQLCSLGWVEHLRHGTFGEASTRLLICGYWLGVLVVGMAVVLRLSSVVEVDTRRKVFHGMMVAMLLPATYVDPVFAGFSLILMLAIFLLLDLFRASQLPPLSKPLAYFLTPYVDGRDLRGPVVVSHIFLLIGCAIPLWLSLADVVRSGRGPWTGWDVPLRDVSMVSGVICVGMGDAAASLLGRRFGRRKWPWSGGKSVEGSVAFAVAVTTGLGVAKAWLRVGGWIGNNDDSWALTLGKAVSASCVASLTEAVLTGGNDNVVVPVVLWLLVKGLRI